MSWRWRRWWPRLVVLDVVVVVVRSLAISLVSSNTILLLTLLTPVMSVQSFAGGAVNPRSVCQDPKMLQASSATRHWLAL